MQICSLAGLSSSCRISAKMSKQLSTLLNAISNESYVNRNKVICENKIKLKHVK